MTAERSPLWETKKLLNLADVKLEAHYGSFSGVAFGDNHWECVVVAGH
jgi:hypothetical protein